MKVSLGKIVLVFLFVVLAVNFLAAQIPLQRADNQKLAPNGDGTTSLIPGDDAAKTGPTGQTVITGNGINYNGGPVLKGNPVPIYVIWYGNWNSTGSNTQATVTLLGTFLNSIGGTGYETINTLYGDTTGNVSGNLNLGGQIFDSGSQGTKLTNTKLTAIVTRGLSNGLPTDPN